MAGRLLFPEQRALDVSGNPISGAKCYCFTTGGTTPQTAYTSAALSVAHTNPVVADSDGHFPDIYAASDLAYRLVITDGTESSYAGATPLHDADHDPVYSQGAATNPAPLSKSNSYTVTSDDLDRNVYGTGTWALTLPIGSTLTTGWRFRAINEGVGTITLTCQSSDTVNGSATKALGRATAWDVEWNGSAFKAVEVSAGTGRHALWVPAEAMLARVTNGPSVSVSETSTNKINRRTLDFDASTVQYAQFRVVMPKSWDEGTLTVVPVWTHGSTSTNFGVSWGMQAVAISDQDAGDAAFGTAIYTNDTGGTTGTIYKGPESAAITVAGSPAAEDVVTFQLLRKADDAVNDTLAVVASLIGVVVYINTDAGQDA